VGVILFFQTPLYADLPRNLHAYLSVHHIICPVHFYALMIEDILFALSVCLFIDCFTCCSRIFHLYGVVTIAGEGLQNF
jgi:hypothetical protein